VPQDPDTISLEEFRSLRPVLLCQLDEDTGGIVVALDNHAFSTPGVWGIVIADLVQHIANAYAQDGMAAAPVMAQIRSVVLAELESPTDKAVPMRWEIA
jgi:hypothetical protein